MSYILENNLESLEIKREEIEEKIKLTQTYKPLYNHFRYDADKIIGLLWKTKISLIDNRKEIYKSKSHDEMRKIREEVDLVCENISKLKIGINLFCGEILNPGVDIKGYKSRLNSFLKSYQKVEEEVETIKGIMR